MAERPDYSRLLLNVENELKRMGNKRDWSLAKRRALQEKIDRLRALLMPEYPSRG
jgi:hypothetical protein